jgi:hypothetical protein
MITFMTVNDFTASLGHASAYAMSLDFLLMDSFWAALGFDDRRPTTDDRRPTTDEQKATDSRIHRLLTICESVNLWPFAASRSSSLRETR